MLISDVPTPALVLDLAALDRNIRRMAAFFAEGPCRLRPHVKAHKTPAIARRQLEAGSCSGLTCATLGEAEAVATVCDDVLIANEIAGAGACARLAALARRMSTRNPSATLTVAVDSVAGLNGIAAEAQRAGVTVGVLVDVNVGQNRCGVSSADGALALARSVAGASSLRLRGVMGYEGHAQPLRDRVERTAATRRAMSILIAAAHGLRDARLPCEVVSAGGTGTYDISGRAPEVTEVQAGSYALMDSDYADVGVPFEQAFWVLGTVVSRPEPDRLVADCGHKAVTKDHGLPRVCELEGATVTTLNDEHAVIRVPRDTTLQVGDRIRLIPSHTDPTVNLHDVFYVIDAGRVVDRWSIAARGYPEQRESSARDPGLGSRDW